MNDGIKNYGQIIIRHENLFLGHSKIHKIFCNKIPAFWIEPKIRNVKISIILIYFLSKKIGSRYLYIYSGHLSFFYWPNQNRRQKIIYISITRIFPIPEMLLEKKCQVREYFMIHFYSNQQHDQQIISSAFKAKLYTI